MPGRSGINRRVPWMPANPPGVLRGGNALPGLRQGNQPVSRLDHAMVYALRVASRSWRLAVVGHGGPGLRWRRPAGGSSFQGTRTRRHQSSRGDRNAIGEASERVGVGAEFEHGPPRVSPSPWCVWHAAQRSTAARSGADGVRRAPRVRARFRPASSDPAAYRVPRIVVCSCALCHPPAPGGRRLNARDTRQAAHARLPLIFYTLTQCNNLRSGTL